MAKNKIWIGLVGGVIGGIAASFVMEQFQALLKKAEDSEQAEPPSGGDPATVKAAAAVVEPVLNRELYKEEKEVAGPAMHYAMGAVSGAIYGAVAAAFPFAAAGFGSLFGAILWAVADEGLVPGLGLSKAPAEYPATVHANSLASHIVYGISTDVVRRLIADRLAA